MKEYNSWWISVKQRVPKTNQDVIVWDYKSKCTRKDYYSKAGGMNGWANSREDYITHWMPESLFNKMISKTIQQP